MPHQPLAPPSPTGPQREARDFPFLMSSRKRSAGTSSSTPAASSKQPRVGDGDGVTPATANAANTRPHGRVVLRTLAPGNSVARVPGEE